MLRNCVHKFNNTCFFKHRSYSIINKNRITLISAGFRGGQKKSGTELGPNCLIKANALYQIKHLIGNHIELKLDHFGDRTDIEACSEVSKTLSDTLQKEALAKNFCLTLGGDHSIGTGTVAGLLNAYPDLCVLWIDAHADINTYDASQSKSVHGMPLSFVVDHPDLNCDSHKPYDWVKKGRKLPLDRLAFIGLRDVDQFESDFIKKNNITAYSMDDIDRIGIVNVVKEILQKINPDNSKPIHVSFDVDAIDPIYTSSTGTPVNGGLTLRETQIIAQMKKNTNKLVGLDIVEVNPLLGDASDLNKTISSVKSVIESFILGRYTSN